MKIQGNGFPVGGTVEGKDLVCLRSCKWLGVQWARREWHKTK